MQDSNKETKKQPWEVKSVYRDEHEEKGMVYIDTEATNGICIWYNSVEELSTIQSLEQAQKIAEIIVNALNKNEDGNQSK